MIELAALVETKDSCLPILNRERVHCEKGQLRVEGSCWLREGLALGLEEGLKRRHKAEDSLFISHVREQVVFGCQVNTPVIEELLRVGMAQVEGSVVDDLAKRVRIPSRNI